MKFIKIKGSRETREPGFVEKILPGGWDLMNFDNLICPRVSLDVALGKYGRPVLSLVYYQKQKRRLRIRRHLVSLDEYRNNLTIKTLDELVSGNFPGMSARIELGRGTKS